MNFKSIKNKKIAFFVKKLPLNLIFIPNNVVTAFVKTVFKIILIKKKFSVQSKGASVNFN